jgi:hypothetical protein|tara:strand:+ start:816 stop:1235 length:420 start_codon:yes stop_codon:yes gene_type:complete
MQDANCLAQQIVGAKNKKAELDKLIKKLERDLLDTKLVSALLATIHNEGGETTDGPYTVEIPRTHIWDQSMVDEILEGMPPSEWPSFVTQQTIYKIDMRKFKDYAVNHPSEAGRWHAAHSIKLGESKIKKINADKLKED